VRLRNEITQLEQRLDEMLVKPAAETPSPDVTPGAAALGALVTHVASAYAKNSEITYADRVRALMRNAPSRAFSVTEIGKEIGHANVRSLSTILAKMAERGEVEKLDRGQYRWCPKERRTAPF